MMEEMSTEYPVIGGWSVVPRGNLQAMGKDGED